MSIECLKKEKEKKKKMKEKKKGSKKEPSITFISVVCFTFSDNYDASDFVVVLTDI